VPYHPAHFLKVSTAGINPGDLVIVAGYPGRTFRYRTAAEVQNMQDYVYPTTIRYATDLNAILRDQGINSKETQIANASRIKGNDNVLKNYTGTLTGFNTFGIVQARKAREAQLAKYIASHPEMAKYANVLQDMNALEKQATATQQRDTVFNWLLRSSPMLSQAFTIYRLSLERPKADIDREAGFQQRDWPRITEGVVRAQKTIDLRSDRAGFRYFVTESQKLPDDQRIKALDDAVARAGNVERFLDTIYELNSTKMGDLDVRRAMLNESTEQLMARHDAFLDLAAALMPLALENEKHEKELAGAMSRLRPMYMDALRAMSGGKLYPDANGTLRVTFGKVEGYPPKDGVWYTPQTTVLGVAAKNTGSGEFDAPKAELAAIAEHKWGPYADPQLGAVPVDFLSTVDTTGGNSGSPTLNAKGELCGLLFDGTYESLGSDFIVDPKMTRSIHVDAVYMLWMMDAVDGAHNLLREMGITPKFPQPAASTAAAGTK
jgi:hypothetical protein